MRVPEREAFERILLGAMVDAGPGGAGAAEVVAVGRVWASRRWLDPVALEGSLGRPPRTPYGVVPIGLAACAEPFRREAGARALAALVGCPPAELVAAAAAVASVVDGQEAAWPGLERALSGAATGLEVDDPEAVRALAGRLWARAVRAC